MSRTTFDTHPVLLHTPRKTCEDDVQGRILARQQRQLELVSRRTGHKAPAGPAAEEGDEIPTSMAQDSGLELIEAD